MAANRSKRDVIRKVARAPMQGLGFFDPDCLLQGRASLRSQRISKTGMFISTMTISKRATLLGGYCLRAICRKTSNGKGNLHRSERPMPDSLRYRRRVRHWILMSTWYNQKLEQTDLPTSHGIISSPIALWRTVAGHWRSNR